MNGAGGSERKYSSGVRNLRLMLAAKSRSEQAWSAFRVAAAGRPPASPTKKEAGRSKVEGSSRSRSERTSSHMPVRGLRKLSRPVAARRRMGKSKWERIEVTLVLKVLR